MAVNPVCNKKYSVPGIGIVYCSRLINHEEPCKGSCVMHGEIKSATFEFHKILEPANTALRQDSGKPRYDLIPAFPMFELAEVLRLGAEKYAERNWELGMDWSRCFGSLMRHAWAFWLGEDRDKESGLHHMAHVACNAFFLLEYAYRSTGKDDRPRPRRTNSKEFLEDIRKQSREYLRENPD